MAQRYLSCNANPGSSEQRSTSNTPTLLRAHAEAAQSSCTSVSCLYTKEILHSLPPQQLVPARHLEGISTGQPSTSNHNRLGLVVMDGDLSLSQALGGLRIANPDRASPDSSSQARTATPPSITRRITTSSATEASLDTQQQRRLSLFNILGRRGEPGSDGSLTRKQTPPADMQQQQQQHMPPPQQQQQQPQRRSPQQNEPIMAAQDSAHAAAAQAYRQSQSMPYNHQAQQDALYPPFQAGRGRERDLPIPRPVSGIYSPIAPPQNMPNRQHGSYRLRNESSRTSVLPPRSESRNAEAMNSAGSDNRDGMHRERAYSQGQTHADHIPSRQSSRNIGVGRIHSQQQQGPSPVGQNHGPYGLDGPLVQGSAQWEERGAAVGVRQERDADGKPILRSVKKGVRDFSFGRTLGEGSYSTVLAATDRQTLKEYAVKVLDKRHIIKEKKIKYVNIEKNTLNRLTEHPGIVRLYYTFQDEKSLYYVLDVASNGELLGVLKKIGTFDVECTRFYGAQILDAIDYMHSRGVIHRDLKPENVLLDDQMHVKITDFGTAKLLKDPFVRDRPDGIRPDAEDDDDGRAASFVGTAEYVSPELLTDKNACKASDLWAFGCIIYQLLAGRPPFKAANEYLTFQKIVALEYEFPPGFPPVARDLVERLLVHDPQRRLSMEHIKNHEFFDGMVWGRSLWRQKAPRLKPHVPPEQAPKIISLNGTSSAPQPTPQGYRAPHGNNNQAPSRPVRIITELPPPSQLDIEWSPVLTRNNERILKLGNLMVTTSPISHSPDPEKETKEKKGFSRFFGGGTTIKKRQRLVLITSTGRIILAPSGGDEKKAKTEISLLASDCTWRIQTGEKGQSGWCVDTRGTHYTFEDPRSSAPDPGRTTAEEWLETLESAKDFAMSQKMLGANNERDNFHMESGVSSPASTLGGSAVYPESSNNEGRHGRRNLTKSQASLGMGVLNDMGEGGEVQDKEKKERKHRFSKRNSKNGLAAVF